MIFPCYFFRYFCFLLLSYNLMVISNAPHGSAVEVNHHPLGGVEGEGVGVLDAGHEVSKLWAHEGGPGICGVNVHPQLLLGAYVWRERGDGED